MKNENMYIVWAHPRHDSLTAQVVKAIEHRATTYGFHVSTLDLYRRGFDPVMHTADEPDWDNPDKAFSADIYRLFDELEGQDTLVVVYPLWWYGFPAMLKGYVDRVMNYGLAYGNDHRLLVKRIRWVPLIGLSEERFLTEKWDSHMRQQLSAISSYIGVEDSDISFLFNTIGFEEAIADEKAHYQQLFDKATDMVDTLAVTP